MAAPAVPDDIQQALELFRAQFAERLPAQLAQVEAALAAWAAAPSDDDALRTLHRLVHRLAGSAGTFGMPLFGQACRALEMELDEVLARGQRTQADVESAAGRVAALARPRSGA